MTDVRHLRRLRWGVRGVLSLGVAASVAANILHAQHNPISQTIAAWPPVALFCTLELISRVPLRSRGTARARAGATAVIAAIAAWVSYWHMVGVAAHYGETAASPYLLPLSVDGLIVVASVSLVELGGRISAAGATSGAHEPPMPADGAIHGADPLPDTAPTTEVALDAARDATEPVGGTPIGVTSAPESADSQSPESGRAVYRPASDEDRRMYATWLRETAAGKEPSGVDLARAAGRANDSTGIGRRAARRYREAHEGAHHAATTPSDVFSMPVQSPLLLVASPNRDRTTVRGGGTR